MSEVDGNGDGKGIDIVHQLQGGDALQGGFQKCSIVLSMFFTVANARYLGARIRSSAQDCISAISVASCDISDISGDGARTHTRLLATGGGLGAR